MKAFLKQQAHPETLLAFDYGSRRIGVAVGQQISNTAKGIATVSNNRNGPDWPAVDNLIQDWRPGKLVVGLPLDMHGEATDMSKQADLFAKELGRRYQLPIAMEDERLSSRAAEGLIRDNATPGKSVSRKRLQQRDQVAAALILETYLTRGSDIDKS